MTVKVKTYQEMEALSPGTFSSSSTGSSLASGYLGDISSGLSRSGSSNGKQQMCVGNLKGKKLCGKWYENLALLKLYFLVPSLSEHEIPLTQPSSISLEVRFVHRDLIVYRLPVYFN